MRLLAVAGEPSGDHRGGELLRELRGIAPGVSVYGMGGDAMASEGMELLYSMSDYSVMGFSEVVRSLPSLRRLEQGLRGQCSARRPDCVLLIDYPGFNLRFARWAHGQGIPVVYYVSPQIWAWARGRVRKVHRNVDLMITLFEFERDFYVRRGVNAVWSGHPLADSSACPGTGGREPVVALLPGSRTQEVGRLLPEMLGAFGILRDRGLAERAVVARSAGADASLYRTAGRADDVELADSVHDALSVSRAALVCSGTATLETAVHMVPMVVCYRTSMLTYLLARLLVRGVDRIGMVNIVAGRDVAPELIQGSATASRMAEEAGRLLADGPSRDSALEGLGTVKGRLGPPGGARRAAEALVRFLGAAR
jgi:lipid-A-disaccharide synthase